MKNLTLVFTILLLARVERCHSQNTWTQKADFGWPTTGVPPARSDAVSFSIGNFGYVGTGDGMKDFWQYDPTNNSWTQKADYGGGGRSYATGFSIDSLGYIGTGEDDSSNQTADFWAYDPNDNTWTQKADFGGYARHGAIGLSIGGKGYIGTGGTGEWWSDTLYSDFWGYDPIVDSWSQKADFGGGLRQYAVGFAIGGKGYVGTGLIIPDQWSTLGTKDFWEYDPDYDKWTQKSDFGGNALWNAAGFSIDSLGYLGTGIKEDGDDNTKQFWEYNPATDAWTQKEDFGGNVRSGCPAFSIGSKGYIGMGVVYTDDYGSYYAGDFWEYDPVENSWTQKSDFNGSIQSGCVGFSIGNKGYMGTGITGETPYSGYSVHKDFWEYDPDANTWTQKADFGGTARWQAVGFSIGGKGYIGTGLDFYYGTLKDFWEYDPNANTWTQKADFGGGLRSFAVGFSIGNFGYVGTGNGMKDFWQYDPADDTWTQKSDFGGTGREGAVGFSIGSKGYLGTGYFYDGTEHFYKDFWEYDPDADNWTQKTDFNGTGRWEAVGFSISNKGYLGTGSAQSNSYKDFWEYDPDDDTWTQKADYGGGSRSAATGFSIGNKGYIGTGDDFNEFNDFWEYTPDLDIGIPSINDDACALSVFPNPTNGAFITYLKWSDEENQKATVEVLNLLGQKVYSQQVQLLNGELQKEIHLNDAGDGMYLVKAIINEKVYSTQINLQK